MLEWAKAALMPPPSAGTPVGAGNQVQGGAAPAGEGLGIEVRLEGNQEFSSSHLPQYLNTTCLGGTNPP